MQPQPKAVARTIVPTTKPAMPTVMTAATSATAPRVVQPAVTVAATSATKLTPSPVVMKAAPTAPAAVAGAPVIRRVAAQPTLPAAPSGSLQWGTRAPELERSPTGTVTGTVKPATMSAPIVRPVGSAPALASSVRTVPAAALGTTVTRPVATTVQAAAPGPAVIRKVIAKPVEGNAGVNPTSSLGPVVPETTPHPAAGPGLTQGAYEQKHQDDPKLKNLRELRKTSGLKEIPVGVGLKTLKSYADDGKLTRDGFVKGYEELLTNHNVEVPSTDVKNAVFDLFDRDDNHIVDMMELICGISLLCAGSEEEKIHAIFEVFDENGDNFISMDEMYKFLTSVFNVVLTPQVMGVMNSMGVRVDSAQDLASVTALECFKQADLNQDGKLSVDEFKSWFYAPRNDPSFLFSPVRKLLQ
mmetsp:Transcript_15748/g.28691  ORF Transcript_15748/g.28691 Transcript_15748/m.28691 type:complete len:413 (-) Transcript_15748:89-1327(-)